MIQRNKHPSGRLSNMAFGLLGVADGLVRVLSAGFLHSTFMIDFSRKQARTHIDKIKKGSK